jgi:hypothetical protein
MWQTFQILNPLSQLQVWLCRQFFQSISGNWANCVRACDRMYWF